MSGPRFIDDWDDDNPALRRTRDALRSLENPPPEPPRTAPEPEQLPDTTEERQERVAGLLGRLRAGDHSAAALLRRLIDK